MARQGKKLRLRVARRCLGPGARVGVRRGAARAVQPNELVRARNQAAAIRRWAASGGGAKA